MRSSQRSVLPEPDRRTHPPRLSQQGVRAEVGHVGGTGERHRHRRQHRLRCCQRRRGRGQHHLRPGAAPAGPPGPLDHVARQGHETRQRGHVDEVGRRVFECHFERAVVQGADANRGGIGLLAGVVGACGNCHGSPLDTLREEQSLAGRSLKTAILSALSQRLLNNQTLAQFGLSCRPVDNWQEAITSRVQPHDRVTLIGFGGGLDVLCTLPDVDHLYVCDLMFAETVYQSMAKDHIAQLCVHPDKVQLASQVTATQMARSEICCITGSAICNGTLDELLALAQGCREIILQGPSCSVFPIALFLSLIHI